MCFCDSPTKRNGNLQVVIVSKSRPKLGYTATLLCSLFVVVPCENMWWWHNDATPQTAQISRNCFDTLSMFIYIVTCIFSFIYLPIVMTRIVSNLECISGAVVLWDLWLSLLLNMYWWESQAQYGNRGSRGLQQHVGPYSYTLLHSNQAHVRNSNLQGKWVHSQGD